MGSKNLTVVMEKIRKSSDTEMPQARITDIVTKLTEVEPVKAPDNNVRKALGVRPEDKFLFACSTRCISPGDVFPQIGTLFVFERLLSFQRTFWQNPALTFPFAKIQRVVKSRISFPPFFDVAIQIQMVDKGVSHHIGPLDHRDLVFDLIMALIRHNAAPDSTNSDTLIGLGLIVVEDVYENERAGLFRGFGPVQLDRGHYTDEEGNVKLKDNLKLPSAEWRWISPWQLDRHHAHVDEDGWEYAVGWRTTWGERTPTTFVRRRKWIRKRMLLPNASDKTHRPAHLGQEIELFDDDGKPTGKFYL